ncbi:hypothetical protein Hanom_Chr11g01040131 [Helianthus anomalus]
MNFKKHFGFYERKHSRLPKTEIKYQEKEKAHIFSKNRSLEIHQQTSFFKRRGVMRVKTPYNMFIRRDNIFINIRNLNRVPTKISKKQHRRTKVFSC